MSAWHEGIYGNDDAQEFLGLLHVIAEEAEDISEVIESAHNHPCAEFRACRFVLADLEADFIGEITDYSDIIQLLEWEMADDQLNRWMNRERRLTVLQRFRQSLDQRRLNFDVWSEKTWETFFQWIEQKQQADISESLS